MKPTLSNTTRDNSVSINGAKSWSSLQPLLKKAVPITTGLRIEDNNRVIIVNLDSIEVYEYNVKDPKASIEDGPNHKSPGETRVTTFNLKDNNIQVVQTEMLERHGLPNQEVQLSSSEASDMFNEVFKKVETHCKKNTDKGVLTKIGQGIRSKIHGVLENIS